MAQPSVATPAPVLTLADPSGEYIIAKVMLRLIPFMILLYLMNYLDRVNISFAKFQMKQDLNFNDAIYGFGTSIFFIGYFLFEVPSNLIMERVGPRLWMARIMITWGIISTCMMFVRGAKSFYLLRLSLGFAEAGFFPGMILYLTYWIPAQQRARAAAWFLTSTALAGVIGSPLASVFLKFTAYNMHGWQWLFLIEGIPTILLGLTVLLFLPDRPATARFLTQRERDWLTAHIQADAGPAHHHSHRLSDGLTNPRVWLLAGIYGCIMFGFYCINYWNTSVIKAVSGLSDSKTALLNTIPFTCAIVGMVLIGFYADRTGKRRRTVFFSALIGALGLGICPLFTSTPLVVASLSIAAVGIWGTLGPFWALPSVFLRGTAAAAGIALINSAGNFIGGFIGPNMMGYVKEHLHNYNLGLLIFAGGLLSCAALTTALPKDAIVERGFPLD